MTRKLQTLIVQLLHGPGAQPHVHFHQGPQGGPVPCFDEGCPNPRLSP